MSTSIDFKKAAGTILENVGGKDNVTECYHCMSRLRLQLKDASVVDLDAIKNLGFIDALMNGPQLQVIAGNDVYKLYDAMVKLVGTEVKHGEVNDDGTPAKKKITVKSIFFGIFGSIAGAVQPCIPILIGAGMLKGIYLILWQIGILSDTSSTYKVLEFACDTAFYYLPVFVGYNCAKKNGGNPVLGAFIGAMLLHPNFIAMVADGTAISLLGIPVRAVNYSNSVLPAFVAVYVMCHVEKFIAKHSPDIARVVLEPFGTVLVMVPLTLWVFAPIGDYLSIVLQTVLGWVYNAAGPFAPAIISALIPFLVVTGTHLALGPLAMMTLSSVGMEYVLMPSAILHNFTHGALSLGVALKSKNKDTKSTGFSCCFTALIAGISEPSLYGIALKNKVALAALIAGQFCGGLYFGLTHTGIYTMPGAGLTFLSLAIYIGPEFSNFVNGCIGTVIAMAVAFIITFLFYKDGKGDIAAAK